MTLDFEIDETFVSRLLLGALSEHEQRMLAASLARSDPEFRRALSAFLESFETFDSDLVAEYSAVLDRDPIEIETERRAILERSFARAADMEMLIHGLTVTDALSLGRVTRKFFSWTMAELLLAQSQEAAVDRHRSRTRSYLALMVIDVVELLGIVERTPLFDNVIADVRQRIREAAEPSETRELPPS